MTATAIDARVQDFTTTTHQLFIGGQWVDAASGETFDTPDPATGEKLATVAAGGAEDIDRCPRTSSTTWRGGRLRAP